MMSARGADRRPNLIVIMADDLSSKELGCYGHPRHKTPHLDELARTGLQFDTCYTACICHPTRFEIMTGQYGSTNGVYHFAGRDGGPDRDSPEEQIVNHLTFGKVLQSAGYATAMSGKWQLTGEHPTLVRENGFDEYCIWAYKHNLPAGVEHTGGWEGKPGVKTSRYWHPSIVRNGKYVPTTIDDYGPDIYADFVIDFATRHREGPFFIYYPMTLTTVRLTRRRSRIRTSRRSSETRSRRSLVKTSSIWICSSGGSSQRSMTSDSGKIRSSSSPVITGPAAKGKRLPLKQAHASR